MKNQSLSQKIRTLIERGHSNKYIVDKLQCNPRTVYNMRYRVNKDRGIAALGKPAPKRSKPVVPVVAPVEPKGTGIKSSGSSSEPVSIEFVGPEPMTTRDKLLMAATVLLVIALCSVSIWGHK